MVQDFNFDWKFNLGDDKAWSKPGFDDSGWRVLHLPHDWSIEGEFDESNPATPGGGALPGGVGWYRKTFTTPDADRVFVEFDGVYMNSTIYVNGHKVGSRPYGYSSFSYDITSALKDKGQKNVIAVRCDNSEQPNSRWYSGSGIYRNVRLVCTEDSYVSYDGVYVTTPSVDEHSALVHVDARVTGDVDDYDRVVFIVLDPEGRRVAETDGACIQAVSGASTDGESGAAKARSGDASGNGEAGSLWSADITISEPWLWEIDNPGMYTVITQVWDDDELEDVYEQTFGVRTISWDIDRGFFLNGRAVKLLGVCLHHDMGCLGSAVHTRALERELGMMKDMGVNAIRTSHNPPAPEMLDICDRMGLLVMDEAFDMWRLPKKEFDYGRFFDQWHERDLKDFIRRDRNHPCIIMWSIGNEIMEQWEGGETSTRLTSHLSDIVREMDPTRYVASGCNNVSPGNFLFASGALDVYGVNYSIDRYDSMKEWYPDKLILGSETVSSLNSRGVYFQPSTEVERNHEDIEGYQPLHGNQCNGYDASCAPWGQLHEEGWIAVRDRDFIAGTFIWTGFDYLGEPTPYQWPARSSYFGIVDLAGFPKDAYYMYQSEWTDREVLHLYPHWNWAPGDSVDVICYYSKADEVELFVNGRSFGKQSKTHDVLHAQWLNVPWEAGKIEVAAYRDGKECGRQVRWTAGEPASLKLTPDRTVITADGYDLSYVTVEALDAEGREVPAASDMLHFSVEGAGELFGVDNGNAADTLCLKGSDKAFFGGKALAVIRSIKGKRGNVTLTVTSDFDTASTVIKTTK